MVISSQEQHKSQEQRGAGWSVGVVWIGVVCFHLPVPHPPWTLELAQGPEGFNSVDVAQGHALAGRGG